MNLLYERELLSFLLILHSWWHEKASYTRRYEALGVWREGEKKCDYIDFLANYLFLNRFSGRYVIANELYVRSFILDF